MSEETIYPPNPISSVSRPVLPARPPAESFQYRDYPFEFAMLNYSCKSCIHFIAEAKECTVVDNGAGNISPDGWCVLWAGAIELDRPTNLFG